MFKKVWIWFKKLWSKLDDLSDKLIPLASAVVEGAKKAIEYKDFNMIVTVVKSLTPDVADAVIDKAVELAKKYIPKIALQLEVIESLSDIEDVEEQMIAVFKKLEDISDEKWQRFCTGLAQEILVALADGKITWGEAGGFVEYYYRNYLKE